MTDLTQEQARDFVDSLAENRLSEFSADLDRALQVIVNSWADDSHAFIELLQNANDAGPAEGESGVDVRISFDDRGVQFAHNGLPFTAANLDSLCHVGDSTKTRESGSIGFMGIGFKSVFRVARPVRLYSGPFSVEFAPEHTPNWSYGWILTPRWCGVTPPHELEAGWTLFDMPFARPGAATSERLSSRVVQLLGPLSLLFTEAIRSIQVSRAGELLKEVRRDGDNWVTTDASGEHRASFQVCKGEYPVPEDVRDELRVEEAERASVTSTTVALIFERSPVDGTLIPMDPPSCIFAFLPTDQPESLGVVVQADFLLDTQRSRLDASLEWNRHLLRCAAGLYVETLKTARARPADLDAMLRQLPAIPDADSASVVDECFINELRARLTDTPIVPLAGGGWTAPRRTAIASDGIRGLLPMSWLQEMQNRDGYIARSLSAVSVRALRGLGAREISDEDLVEALRDDAWRADRDVSWFDRAHAYWATRRDSLNPRAWRNLRAQIIDLPVVPTMDETLASPGVAYFPPEDESLAPLTSALPGIKLCAPAAFRSPGAKSNLADLGVRPFEVSTLARGLLDEIPNSGLTEWSDAQFSAVEALLREWASQQRYERTAADTGRLRKAPVRSEAGEWTCAGSLYQRAPVVEALVKDAIYVPAGGDSRWQRYLAWLEVTPFPRVRRLTALLRGVVPFPAGYISSVERPQSTTRTPTIEGSAMLPCLEEDLDESEARLFLAALTEHWAYYRQHLGAALRWYYYSDQSRRIASCFAWQLRSRDWIPTTAGIKSAKDLPLAPTRELRHLFSGLAPFVETDPARADDLHELWDAIGVPYALAPPVAARVLAACASPSDPETERRLSECFVMLGRRLAAADDDEAYASWSGALRNVPAILSDGTRSESTETYWADDAELERLFSSDLPLAWVPRGVERPALRALFDAWGVRPLSTAVRYQDVGFEGAVEVPSGKIRRFAVELASVVAHHSGTLAIEAVTCFSRLSTYRCDSIAALASVNDVPRTLSPSAWLDTASGAFAEVEGASDLDSAGEIARAFGLGRDAVAPLHTVLGSHSRADAQSALERMGIAMIDEQLLANLELPDLADPEPDEGEAGANGEEPIITTVDSASGLPVAPYPTGPPTGTNTPAAPAAPPTIRITSPEPRDLPPLSTVTVTEGQPTPVPGGHLPPRGPDITSGAPGGDRPPPAPAPGAAEVGRRAEELVYRWERERVAGLGYDPDVVTWISDQNPGADHDFESVDEYGDPIVIEVKAAGSGGTFLWTIREYSLASVEGNAYWLYLVLDATSEAATLHRLSNPVEAIEEGRLAVQTRLIEAHLTPNEGFDAGA